jgi:4-hydroxy-3-polyprenylbenzoate decarboxylase
VRTLLNRKYMEKVIIGLGGSSGALYGKLLLDRLAAISDQWAEVGIIMSKNASLNWALELEGTAIESYGFRVYNNDDFSAPFASGSAQFMKMIICPCSMGTLARIAHGLSDDLMTRAADVILKERRQLIVVPRETPFSLIHLDNMRKLTKAGAIVCPAIPSFYGQVKTIEQACQTVIDRVMDLAGFKIDTFRWGESG